MQNIIYILLFISCSILVYFVVFLVGTHISISRKNSKKNHIRTQLYKGIKNNNFEMFNSDKFKNTLAIDVISEELENLNGNEKDTLINLLNKSNFNDYVKKIIKLNKVNEDTIFYIKFVGDLGIKSLSSKLISLMKKYPNNTDLQYYCLDALAKFGDRSYFLNALNLGYTIKLTSRALQEIFSDYKGDYEDIFEELLDSKDPYILRMVILMIGDLKIDSLVPRITNYINSEDMDISISAIKVLSRMKYKKAYKDIIKMSNSKHWQVRSVVLKYAGKLDLESSIDLLLEGLKDEEWWVRFNAAKALARSKNRDYIIKQVSKSNDKYAMEMLKYAIKDYMINGGE